MMSVEGRTETTLFSVVSMPLQPLPPSRGGGTVPRCHTAGEECVCSHQCVTGASPEGVVMVESETDGDRWTDQWPVSSKQQTD